MRDNQRRFIVALAYAIGFVLGVYIVTRPRVRTVIVEHLPSPADVSKVLRRAEQITQEAVDTAGKEGS
jgi:hypothetical protein